MSTPLDLAELRAMNDLEAATYLVGRSCAELRGLVELAGAKVRRGAEKYENETFEVDDQVGEGETPRAAVERLRLLVDEMQRDAAAWRAEQRRQLTEQNGRGF